MADDDNQIRNRRDEDDALDAERGWFTHLPAETRRKLLRIEASEIDDLISMSRAYHTARVLGRGAKWLFLATLGLLVLIDQFWVQVTDLITKMRGH